MNPILQMLNNPQSSNILSQFNQIRNMLSGKNPDDMYNQLMKNNPQFRHFVEANANKTPQQIASENGIDFNTIEQFMK